MDKGRTVIKMFGSVPITMHVTERGQRMGYVDIELNDNYCKANGHDGGRKELLYKLGASAEQIKSESGLPKWVRHWADGRITSTAQEF